MVRFSLQHAQHAITEGSYVVHTSWQKFYEEVSGPRWLRLHIASSAISSFEILGLIPYVTASIMDDTPPVNRSRTREMKLKRTVECGSKTLQEALLYSALDWIWRQHLR